MDRNRLAPISLLTTAGAESKPAENEFPLHVAHMGDEVLLRKIRGIWPGVLVLNRGGAGLRARIADIDNGTADVIAVGAMSLANPDLVERIKTNAPLNAPDPSTFYGGGTKGYADYPTLAMTTHQSDGMAIASDADKRRPCNGTTRYFLVPETRRKYALLQPGKHVSVGSYSSRDLTASKDGHPDRQAQLF